MNETKKDGIPFVSLALLICFILLVFPLILELGRMGGMRFLDFPDDSLYSQAVENCPNGWEINRFCTEKIYNYSCRNDGQNITYIC